MFCANPDKGRGYKANTTYPMNACPQCVFCVGAATSGGNHWERIDPEDKSVNFFLPGVDLGIPVHTRNNDRKDQPPNKWEKYSGSSVSCALAAGLAAMILHVAKISGVTDEEYDWLKKREGVRAAFEKIYKTNDNWLPVRMLFGIRSLREGNDDDKKKALKEGVMDRILAARKEAPGKTG
jgi:hypothetical protein